MEKTKPWQFADTGDMAFFLVGAPDELARVLMLERASAETAEISLKAFFDSAPIEIVEDLAASISLLLMTRDLPA